MNRFFKAFAILAVTMLCTVNSFGQSSKAYRVTVPFSFVVDGKQLPAGTYKIVVDSDDRSIAFESTTELNRVATAYTPTHFDDPANGQLRLQFSGTDKAFTAFIGSGGGGAALIRNEMKLAKKSSSSVKQAAD